MSKPQRRWSREQIRRLFNPYVTNDVVTQFGASGAETVRYLSAIVGGRKPSTYSASPLLWNAYFRAAGIDAHFFACDVPPQKFPLFLSTMIHAGNWIDLTVTDPFKQDAWQALREAAEKGQFPAEWSAEVPATGTLNHIVSALEGKKFYLLNTDGKGLVKNLRRAVPLQGALVVIIGAGGAATSISYELVRCRARIHLANIVPEETERLVRRIGQWTGPGSGCSAGNFTSLPEMLPFADVVINTVPRGCPVNLIGSAPLKENVVLSETRYGEGGVFADLAAKRGCSYVDGKAMLIGQFEEAADVLARLYHVDARLHSAGIAAARYAM